MKYSMVAVLAAAVAGAHAYGKNVTIVTEVVDKYVTYCPEPTEITHGDKTYTVTEPGTVTITDCPCTITKPVVEETHEVCHDCPEAPKPEEPEVPVETPEVQPPPPTGGMPMPTPPAGEDVPAGAAKLSVAGLAGVVGLAAFIL
jgi:hypothetical protein